jgi:N-acetylglucosamine kinase-like BadF-type ATPase
MANYRIGVDGGGTSTRAVVLDGALNELGRGEAGSSNLYAVGLEATVVNIGDAVTEALEAADLEREQIRGWGFALAGVRSEGVRRELYEGLEVLIGEAPWVIDEDTAGALAGAFATPDGYEFGAICIAGTGANCFGINAAGERAGVDGLGPLLGDRGSGYWIGERALRAACAAGHGVGEATALVRPVLESFGVSEVNDLVPIVYAPDFSRARIAALLPLVLEVAPGDAVAAGILAGAGRELATTTAAVLSKLNLSSVAVIGGVLQNAVPVRTAFEAELTARIPAVTVIEPRRDAAIGAALLVRPH